MFIPSSVFIGILVFLILYLKLEVPVLIAMFYAAAIFILGVIVLLLYVYAPIVLGVAGVLVVHSLRVKYFPTKEEREESKK